VEPLEQALLNCRLVVTAPAPVVAIGAISGSATEFTITFFVADYADAAQTQNELLDHIYRHLTAAGINLAAAPNMTLPPPDARTRPERLIDLTEIFAPLPVAERKAIATSLKPRSYNQGDALLTPGAALGSLCIVASGVASYLRDNGEYEDELMRLGPGDQYGEIALFTGGPSLLRITALTPVLVYELAAEELSGILETHPETSQALDRRRARRQAALSPAEPAKADEALPPYRLRSRLSDWLHRRYDAAASE
jgi:CRP-like cAMP-binding protein